MAGQGYETMTMENYSKENKELESKLADLLGLPLSQVHKTNPQILRTQIEAAITQLEQQSQRVKATISQKNLLDAQQRQRDLVAGNTGGTAVPPTTPVVPPTQLTALKPAEIETIKKHFAGVRLTPARIRVLTTLLNDLGDQTRAWETMLEGIEKDINAATPDQKDFYRQLYDTVHKRLDGAQLQHKRIIGFFYRDGLNIDAIARELRKIISADRLNKLKNEDINESTFSASEFDNLTEKFANQNLTPEQIDTLVASLRSMDASLVSIRAELGELVKQIDSAKTDTELNGYLARYNEKVKQFNETFDKFRADSSLFWYQPFNFNRFLKELNQIANGSNGELAGSVYERYSNAFFTPLEVQQILKLFHKQIIGKDINTINRLVDGFATYHNQILDYFDALDAAAKTNDKAKIADLEFKRNGALELYQKTTGVRFRRIPREQVKSFYNNYLNLLKTAIEKQAEDAEVAEALKELDDQLKKEAEAKERLQKQAEEEQQKAEESAMGMAGLLRNKLARRFKLISSKEYLAAHPDDAPFIKANLVREQELISRFSKGQFFNWKLSKQYTPRAALIDNAFNKLTRLRLRGTKFVNDVVTFVPRKVWQHTLGPTVDSVSSKTDNWFRNTGFGKAFHETRSALKKKKNADASILGVVKDLIFKNVTNLIGQSVKVGQNILGITAAKGALANLSTGEGVRGLIGKAGAAVANTFKSASVLGGALGAGALPAAAVFLATGNPVLGLTAFGGSAAVSAVKGLLEVDRAAIPYLGRGVSRWIFNNSYGQFITADGGLKQAIISGESSVLKGRFDRFGGRFTGTAMGIRALNTGLSFGSVGMLIGGLFGNPALGFAIGAGTGIVGRVAIDAATKTIDKVLEKSVLLRLAAAFPATSYLNAVQTSNWFVNEVRNFRDVYRNDPARYFKERWTFSDDILQDLTAGVNYAGALTFATSLTGLGSALVGNIGQVLGINGAGALAGNGSLLGAITSPAGLGMAAGTIVGITIAAALGVPLGIGVAVGAVTGAGVGALIGAALSAPTGGLAAFFTIAVSSSIGSTIGALIGSIFDRYVGKAMSMTLGVFQAIGVIVNLLNLKDKINAENVVQLTIALVSLLTFMKQSGLMDAVNNCVDDTNCSSSATATTNQSSNFYLANYDVNVISKNQQLKSPQLRELVAVLDKHKEEIATYTATRKVFIAIGVTDSYVDDKILVIGISNTSLTNNNLEAAFNAQLANINADASYLGSI